MNPLWLHGAAPAQCQDRALPSPCRGIGKHPRALQAEGTLARTPQQPVTNCSLEVPCMKGRSQAGCKWYKQRMNFASSLTCMTNWLASVPAHCHKERKISREVAQH